MAGSYFIARKCACGGKLEFDALRKVWTCRYCGTEVEREATFDKIHVDGIEGINDVVRQTLLDVANLKMDSAAKNLEDCERKNHQHIGTLFANISYNLAKISIEKSEDEVRGRLDKIKIYAKRLKEEFPAIAEEEINLYEAFGGDAADIYAILLAVFDTLDDNGRMEYVESKLNPEEVFSSYANKALLRIAIKRNRLETVDVIVHNIGHIDRKYSFKEVLEHYPDNGKKISMITELFSPETVEALKKEYFEYYFGSSNDSMETKVALIGLLNGTDIHCSADSVVKALAAQMDSYENAKLVFKTLYDVKISDQETEGLLVFCLMVNKLYEVQSAFFDTLIEKNVFVALNERTVISFMESSSFPADQKADVIQKMMRFQIDHKALNAIYNYYLNNNHDPIDTRLKILDIILTKDIPIVANTVRTYVLKTTTDEDSKLDVVKKIFATGINKVYLGNLLSDYLLHSTDAELQKKDISDYLISVGFKVDSAVMMQYAASQEDNQEKIDKIKKLIANGTMVKADAINGYILSLSDQNAFSEEIFDLLTENGCSIGFTAYAKYVLLCKDIDKVRHNEKLLITAGDFADQKVNITHCGNNISCNIAQAYILNARENYETARKVLAQISNNRIKLATEVNVNGIMMKFKKYVSGHKNELSPLALQLCEENKMFSFF